ncbi:flippase [Haloferax volcanii]|uniref:flippase n=1 Tax=Haloferax volcanii TaxID=2246 RepID=UPI0038593195
MSLVRSSLKLFAANTGGAVFQFIGIIYFSQDLGASGIGLFFLFQAVLGVATIPADFGLREALEKRLTEGESQGKFLASAILLKLVFAGLVSVVAVLLSGFINDYLGAELVVYLIIGLFSQEIAHIFMSALKGDLRVGETAELNLAQQIVWLIVGAILVEFGYKSEGLIYAYILGFIVIIFWGWIKADISIKTPSLEHSKSLFNYGKYNVLASVGGLFFSWMDILIIGYFLTNAHVGAYEVAWRVTGVVLLLSRSIGTALFPQISSWNSDMSSKKIESALRDYMTPSLFFILPAFFGVLVFGQEILVLVFGSEFELAWVALVILMGGKVAHAGFILLNRGLQGIGKPNLAAYATTVSVISNVVLNVILIQMFGIVGAAIATTTSFLVNAVLHYQYISRYLKVTVPTKELSWCLVSSVAMGLLLQLIENLYAVDNLVSLFIVISIGAGTYSAVILLFKPFRSKFGVVISSLS